MVKGGTLLAFIMDNNNLLFATLLLPKFWSKCIFLMYTAYSCVNSISVLSRDTRSDIRIRKFVFVAYSARISSGSRNGICGKYL